DGRRLLRLPGRPDVVGGRVRLGGVGRDRRDHAAEHARIGGVRERGQLVVLPAQREQAVVVVAVVFADRPLPQQPAGGPVELVDDAHLAGAEHDLAVPGAGEDGRVLEVPVVDVVRQHLVVPDDPAGAAVELDQRVRVEVRAWAARPPGELGGADEGAGVGHRDVEVASAVEAGRVPQAAAGVEVRPAPQVLRYGVEGPFGLAGARVERPQHALALAGEEVAGVARHGRDVDGAAVHAGRHVDAFEVVLDEFLAPQLAAGRGVQREGVRAGRAEHLAVGDGDAVRADAAVVVGLGPADGAGAQVDRVHVGVEVLGVDDASGHHGCGGVAAGPQVGACLDGDPPGDAEAGDGAGVDRAVHPAGGGLVAVRLAP